MAETALNGQLPQHIASTGGLLNSAETEEKYAITWTSKTEQAFELCDLQSGRVFFWRAHSHRLGSDAIFRDGETPWRFLQRF